MSILKRFSVSTTAIPFAFACIKLLIHLYTNGFAGYGYFRDELYYLACANHLDFGYVDQPPLSIFILALQRFVIGDSLFAVRFLPAVAGALTVYFTGRIVSELRGGAFAQSIACFASIVSLINLAVNTIYSMNAFDFFIWTVAAYLLLRIMKSNEPRYWYTLGFVIGFSLLNKIDVMWLCVGIFIGMIFTQQREWFKTKCLYITAIIAFVLFLPYILWNVFHDFAHLEFIHNATSGKYSGLTPLDFISGQFLINNPATCIVWIAGIYFLLFTRIGKEFRLLGYIYVTAFVILLINGHSKAEYLAPAYGMLFAAGGVGMEQILHHGWQRFLKPVLVLILLAGIALAPVTLPILPVDSYIKYSKALHITPNTSEDIRLAELPQFYADMFGWEEKAAAVAKVYNSLSSEEKIKCAIFADNYGRCGAMDFFGEKYGLPQSIGRHNNYWLWGPRNYTGELVIILGGALEDKQESFEKVVIADSVSSRYCIPYENNLRIYICRKLHTPLDQFWPRLKHYE